jgi:flagellar protein FliL
MRKILPILLAVLGLGAGVGAGKFLRPAPMEPDQAAMEGDHATGEGGDHVTAPEGEEGDMAPEYVKLSNQFVIPVLEEGRIASMVILSINLEVTTGASEAVYAQEPKLRDGFLQVLFNHANAGGFQGSFTDGANMVNLRTALHEVASQVLGDKLKDVLIVDIGRQDS